MNTLAPVESSKPEAERISLLVPKELRSRLVEMAEKERRSLSGQCIVMLERQIEAAPVAA